MKADTPSLTVYHRQHDKVAGSQMYFFQIEWSGQWENMHSSLFSYRCGFVSRTIDPSFPDECKIDEKLITAIQRFPALYIFDLEHTFEKKS